MTDDGSDDMDWNEAADEGITEEREIISLPLADHATSEVIFSRSGHHHSEKVSWKVFCSFMAAAGIAFRGNCGSK